MLSWNPLCMVLFIMSVNEIVIDRNKIRNFSIIAHIDHGKSTLADRLIESCNGLTAREMTAQVLDSMDIERERGITIKAQTVRLLYNAKDGNTYILNLIDTPGHVDFSYEVSRSLAACEGSLLVVDSTQGVEAQTLANVYKAIENNHSIVPILNKIDLQASEPDKVKKEIEDVIGLDTDNAKLISAKTGIGIQDVLESVVSDIPPPAGNREGKLKALLVDSWYDRYLGVVILLRIKDGVIKKGMKIRMMAAEVVYNVDMVGVFTPKKESVESLSSGEIGYITASIKQVSDCKIGDTITEENNRCDDILSGFKPLRPVVFCSLFPADSSQFNFLRESLEKLQLNDSSIVFEPETSTALGSGFRCGFLGLLHLEVVQERLDTEFDLDLVTTAPGVVHNFYMKDDQVMEVHNPADMPDLMKIDYIEEPWVTATIMVPEDYLGASLNLCIEKRGEQVELSYNNNRAIVIYKLPLSEIIFDFYDKLKSISRGYASFDWEFAAYKKGNVVKVSILINGEIADALSCIINKERAESRGREICMRLKELIPRQQYKVAIQAAIGGKIIARETVQAFRKDVTEKLYGGDRTRKDKLLKKQKKGKKRLRDIGNVQIPQNVFVDALKIPNK